MSDNQHKKRYCIHCLRKDPPVETELVVGVNITEQRWNRSNFVCNDCDRVWQRNYRAGGKSKYAEYLQNLHDETIEEFSVQWEDPAYAKSRIADRLYKVMDKYGRRSPDKGIRKQWILEVIMKDLWFIDANALTDYLVQDIGWSRSKQITGKPYVLQAVVAKLDFLQASPRNLAEQRFDALVDTINKEHEGIDKLVARPPHEDPVTHEYVSNWFLLSRKQEHEWRERMREEAKARSDLINNQERLMVEIREAEVTRRKVDQQRQQQQDENENDKDGEQK